MQEREIQQAVRLVLGQEPDLVLFRNNVGQATTDRGNRIAFGVGGPGGSDLMGIFRGRAVFVEIKTPIGRLSPEQRKFQALVERKGGIYAVVRSVAEAEAWIAELRAAA